MIFKRFLLPLLILAAFSWGDAQAQVAANGDDQQIGLAMRWSGKGTPATSVRIEGTRRDTTIAPHIDIWGADAIGILFNTTQVNTQDSVFIHGQGSLDGNVWSAAIALDTLIAASADANIVTGIIGTPAASTLNGYRMLRLIAFQQSGASTDTTLIHNVRPYVLKKSR